MTDQERYLYTAAMKELQENHGVGRMIVASTTFDDKPQHNEDGSVTHNISLLIHKVKYDVEVYEYKGEYIAECWQTNDKLNDQLVLEEH